MQVLILVLTRRPVYWYSRVTAFSMIGNVSRLRSLSNRLFEFGSCISMLGLRLERLDANPCWIIWVITYAIKVSGLMVHFREGHTKILISQRRRSSKHNIWDEKGKRTMPASCEGRYLRLLKTTLKGPRPKNRAPCQWYIKHWGLTVYSKVDLKSTRKIGHKKI